KSKTTAPVFELRETHQLIRSQSKEVLGYGFTVEWARINSKRHGLNDFPAKLTFECADDYLKYVRAEAEAKVVVRNAKAIEQLSPNSSSWCASHLAMMRKPRETIQNAIKVIVHLKAEPNPGIYARQLPVKVPTKFFEQERGLLEALFQEFAPECLVKDSGGLEERLGLMTKESLIEFRTLDSTVQSLPFGHAMATARELAKKASYFKAFETVIVVENHVPFLILPEFRKTLAIMGNGYAVRRLVDVPWLKNKRVFYWGDIDLSGFSILAQFRAFLAHVESLMMNLETWQHFSSQTQKHEAAQSISDRDFDLLNPEERHLVEILRENSGLRLEQEHIDFEYIKDRVPHGN
ncbi:MAG: Wadjet anti-phage system protein JetD domain-containing protein, partial [Verrucomicrobiales bacterium]